MGDVVRKLHVVPNDGGGAGRVRRANLAQILKAAEQVFAETGFTGATMAEIADKADLPKANLHYYFGTKEELYRAVLDNILVIWQNTVSSILPEADPAQAIADYVRSKMEVARTRPYASKVFANEIIRGAGLIEGFLSNDLKNQVEEKSAILERWMAEGRMARLDPKNLFFMIWAMTQHYADFDAQIRLVLGKRQLSRKDFSHFTEEVVRAVLRIAGLEPPED
ncbi:TetR/AcrR family transcriptional regulator [Telmatospirillum siberiense]|uniref:TetR family transcriptional regulator n=1 Tax=Telmatospirillum siberiense TaxID=382514 RepID=A0A2N3PVS5_9PROT|nr:TetR/AcrR family transcriptional regulator [Telmatospirillum siberiense]PKU24504.1 TetR family transcriptional regulator [Telmatospirillum siberiense]